MTSPAIVSPLPEKQGPFILWLRRLWAVMVRHIYLYMGSWPRLVQMIYWPFINIILWGYTSYYIVKQWTDSPIIRSSFVGGGLLNEVFVRMCLTMTILFLEEVWSRNLGHLFASPIKFLEFVVGLITTSMACMAIGVIPAMVAAWWLFGFSILSFGWPLAAFLFLLVFNGCWFGMLVLALLFRFGLAAEWLGWMLVFLLTPLIAPYYPVSILPYPMQIASWSLPGTYVFECMRGLINHNEFDPSYLWISLGLNIAYFAVASFILYRCYRAAQKRGGILQVGE